MPRHDGATLHPCEPLDVFPRDAMNFTTLRRALRSGKT
jgi:hypothetical protein